MMVKAAEWLKEWRDRREAEEFRTRGRITKWIRGCAVCGAFLPPIDFLCDECRRDLFMIADARDPEKSETSLPFKVRTLMDWIPETEDLVQPVLHGFKGGASSQFAYEMMAMLLEGQNLENTAFIPAPSSKKDHAFLLGRVAADLCGSRTLRLLEPDGDLRKQRDKKREERHARKFRIKDDMANLAGELRSNRVKMVFIDDVITTGATVVAAYEALGRPKGFEAWSLVRRPRLAAKRGF